MTGLRRLCREVARNQSYATNGNTTAMDYIFDKLWRGNGKHKANKVAWRATKKGANHT